mgnify:FL=1
MIHKISEDKKPINLEDSPKKTEPESLKPDINLVDTPASPLERKGSNSNSSAPKSANQLFAKLMSKMTIN